MTSEATKQAALKRIASGEATKKVAKRYGVTRQTINNWKNGKTRNSTKKRAIIEPKIEVNWLESGEYEAMKRRTAILERALGAHLIEEELKRY